MYIYNIIYIPYPHDITNDIPMKLGTSSFAFAAFRTSALVSFALALTQFFQREMTVKMSPVFL
jgi:hypothetical protein